MNKTNQGAALSDADILDAAIEAGLWPNTVHSWLPAFHRYHAILDRRAADRRLTAEQGGADVRDTIREHLTSLYVCTRVWDAWHVGTMTEDDFIPAGETDFVEDLACAIEAAALTTQPQAEPAAWVSIKDRTPQDWSAYLVCNRSGDVEVAVYQFKDGGLDGRKAGRWYLDNDDNTFPATHWMPLPATPTAPTEPT